MSYNLGNTDAITYDGAEVDKLTLDGTTIWEKQDDLSASTCGAVAPNYAFDPNYYLQIMYDSQIAPSLGQGPRTTPSWLDYLSDDDSAFPFVNDSVTNMSTWPAGVLGYTEGTPRLINIDHTNPSSGTFQMEDFFPTTFIQSIKIYPNGTAIYRNEMGPGFDYGDNFTQIIVGTWSGGGVNGDKPIQVKFTNTQPPQLVDPTLTHDGQTWVRNLDYAVVVDPWGDGNTFVDNGIAHVRNLKPGASMGMDFGQEVTLCLNAPTQELVWTPTYGAMQSPSYQDPQNTTQAVTNGWGAPNEPTGFLNPNQDPNGTVNRVLVNGEGLTMERPRGKADHTWLVQKFAKPQTIDWSGVSGAGPLLVLGGVG